VSKLINEARQREEINIALRQTQRLKDAYEVDNPDFLPERDVPQARGYTSPISMMDSIVEDKK
jgi:hypothetical protein